MSSPSENNVSPSHEKKSGAKSEYAAASLTDKHSKKHRSFRDKLFETSTYADVDQKFEKSDKEKSDKEEKTGKLKSESFSKSAIVPNMDGSTHIPPAPLSLVTTRSDDEQSENSEKEKVERPMRGKKCSHFVARDHSVDGNLNKGKAAVDEGRFKENAQSPIKVIEDSVWAIVENVKSIVYSVICIYVAIACIIKDILSACIEKPKRAINLCLEVFLSMLGFFVELFERASVASYQKVKEVSDPSVKVFKKKTSSSYNLIKKKSVSGYEMAKDEVIKLKNMGDGKIKDMRNSAGDAAIEFGSKLKCK